MSPSPSLPNLLPNPDLWAARIASYADLGDDRLNSRLGLILAAFAAKPTDSLPQANNDWGQTKATYRFFANERFGTDDVLQPLVEATTDALRGLPTVLAVQDTSSLNYSALKSTTGLGALNDSDKARGLHMHTTLAVRDDGIALGILDQIYWARSFERSGAARKERPIADKESYKWLAGIEAAENAWAGLPAQEQPRLIHVMDREGDIHEVLQRIADSPHFGIIRCAQNRSVDDVNDKAFAALQATPCLATITVAVPRLSHQASAATTPRQATLELRTVTLTITPDPYKYPHRQAVTWTLVEAREINAPAGVEPLHWRLWTNLPASTLAELRDILRWYGFRWRIEDFHLILKSGCQVEKLELEDADRLIKAAMLYAAVAVRILSLRDLARLEAHTPCTAILSGDEWQALWLRFSKQKLTADTPVPTLQQALRWIGQLGGHLGRKRDGLPGVRTLWRGFRDLSLLAAGLRIGRSLR